MTCDLPYEEKYDKVPYSGKGQRKLVLWIVLRSAWNLNYVFDQGDLPMRYLKVGDALAVDELTLYGKNSLLMMKKNVTPETDLGLLQHPR